MGSPSVKVLVASRSSAGVDQIVERVKFPCYFSKALDLLNSFQSFCLNIGWLYTRLVASNSFAPENGEEDHESETNAGRLTYLTNPIHKFMAMYICLIFIHSIID